MAIATIPQAILRGDISIYLSSNANANGALFGRKIASPISPVTIALVTDALRWGYDGGAQTDESLREVANYLVWLTGMYGQQAEYIADGAGGGNVIPTDASLPNPYDWAVGATASATAPLADGESTITFDGTGITRDLRGYNIEFTRNNLTQNTTNAGVGTSYYSWNRVTGLLTISPAATTDELMRILPTK